MATGNHARRPAVVHAIVILAIAVTALLAMPATAHAATKRPKTIIGDLKDCKGTITLFLNGQPKNSYSYDMPYACEKPDELKKIKSSNPKVVEAKAYTYWNQGGLALTAMKPGTSKVSYTYKGKRRTFKVVVKKYPSPIKQLKVGGKNLTNKLKHVNSYSFPSAIRNGQYTTYDLTGKTISVKAKKGWKISCIYAFPQKHFLADSHLNYKRIKNGSKLPKCYDVYVELQNTKTKDYMHDLVSIPQT